MFLCETPRLLPLAVANRTLSYSPFIDHHSLYCTMFMFVSTHFGWCELYMIGFSIPSRSESVNRQCLDTKLLTSGEECFEATSVRNLVYLLQLLYMYQATMCPSSGELTVSMRLWYFSLCMGGCLVCCSRPDRLYRDARSTKHKNESFLTV